MGMELTAVKQRWEKDTDEYLPGIVQVRQAMMSISLSTSMPVAAALSPYVRYSHHVLCGM